MKGLLRGIPTLLLTSEKPEIHRVLLPKPYARYKTVIVPVAKEPQIIAPYESEIPIAVGLRRLNPASINFRRPCILSTQFGLLRAIIRPISLNHVDHFLQPVSCHKLLADFSEFSPVSITSHSFKIAGAHIDTLDSSAIAIHVDLDEFSYIHLNEHVLIKIEPALKGPLISTFNFPTLSSGVFEDEMFYTITAVIKKDIIDHLTFCKTQYWEDFTLLSQPRVHTYCHKDSLLQPPIRRRNVSSPITHGGQPRALEHIRRDKKAEPSKAFDPHPRKRTEILCERRGISWRFFDVNESKLCDFSWQNEFTWFKLSGESLNRGRLVKYATDGYYLLVAPSDWTPQNIDSSCFIDHQKDQLDVEHWCGYRISANQKDFDFPRFRTANGTEQICEWSRKRFVLEGNQISDASSRLGSLFGPNPPKIRANSTNDWKEIRTIVLGEEGTGRNRARWELHPQGAQQVQDLLSKYIAQRSGWYFLRFYDREDDLLESCDFRFVHGLLEIDYLWDLMIPSSDGHQPAEVVLRHNKSISIISEQHRLPEPRRISENETRVMIPSHPQYDNSEWRFDNKVPVKLELNRLWWGTADEKADEAIIDWVDKPFELEESQFNATSFEALWLKLPRITDMGSVYYGFNRSSARKLPQVHRGGSFPIVLRQFDGASELREGDASLQLWITKLIGDGARNECRILLAKTKRKNWYCKIARCAFILEEWCRAEAHLRKSHTDYGFTILTYTEAQTKGLYKKGFPIKIYQCPYNPEHFVDATSTFCSPNSLITNHIERECQNARESMHFGPIKISFEVVDDAERIRRAHLPTLPIWVQCQVCNEFFKKSTDDLSEDIYSHLVKAHRNELFERK